MFSILASSELNKWHLYHQLTDAYNGKIAIAGQENCEGIEEQVKYVWKWGHQNSELKALMYMCNDPIYTILFGSKIPNKTQMKAAIDVIYQDMESDVTRYY